MDISTRWWLRRCLKFQASKTSRQTIRSPILSLPLPNGPGILVSVDYFEPLPITTRGNVYILLFTDRFSRRADMYATTETEFTASGAFGMLIDRYTLLWECPGTLVSEDGLPLCSQLSCALYERLGNNKITTGSYHPCTNSGVERLNHTMALMIDMVVNELQYS